MDFNPNNDGYNYVQHGHPFEGPSYYSSQFVPSWTQSTTYQPPNGGEQLVPDSSHQVYNVNSTQNFVPVVPSGSPPQPIGHRTLYGSYLPVPAQDSSWYNYDDDPNQSMYPVPPGLPPHQQPQPSFIPPQPILLQSTMGVPNQDYLTPPMGQFQTPEPTVSSAYLQPCDVIPDPFPLGFVNITLPVYPGNEHLLSNIMTMSAPLGDPISTEQVQSNLTPTSYPWYRPPGNSSQLPQTEWASNQNRWKGQNRKEKLSKRGWEQSNWNTMEEPTPSNGKRRAHLSARSYCKLCLSNGQSLNFCYSHTVQDEKGNITCPVLRANVCRLCGGTGDHAHTLRYCPLRNRQLSSRASWDDSEKE